MMDSTKRNNILSHIDKIEQYARQPENEWLLAELRQRFSVGDKVDEIYEYCIEKNITNQANGFYQDFPIKSIVPQLERDFVRMERSRRRNEFDDFAMSAYQQIECITNEICRSKKFDVVVSRLMGHPAYVGSTQTAPGKWESPSVSSRSGTFQIARLLFGKDADEKSKGTVQGFWAMDKVYTVLYFVCYGAKLQSSMYDVFVSQKETLNDI